MLFLWAGMAAFASFRVGLLLAIYDFAHQQQQPDTEEGVENLFDDAQLISSFETLRRTNNAVFRSAGLAHLAYLATAFDPGSVAATSSDARHEAGLIEGFALIDEGRQLLEQGRPRSGAEAIWRGNMRILEHEQKVIVNHFFAQCTFQLGLVMTLGTSLDFDGNHLHRDFATYCSFRRFMWTRGLWRLVATLSLPDITRLDHRWPWVRDSVLPTWRRVVERDQDLTRKLKKIALVAAPFAAEAFLAAVPPPPASLATR
jgi:hypothetical protein